MDEILNRRCADMTVLEVLKLAHLKSRVEKPFIGTAEFHKLSGIDRRTLHSYLYHDLKGVRGLVFGGYEKYQKFNKRKPLCLDTLKVLEWLENRI